MIFKPLSIDFASDRMSLHLGFWLSDLDGLQSLNHLWVL